jgi:cell wall-associated NlpC family hydrolase
VRINDRIGEPHPPDGCTGYACRIASEVHGMPIADPLNDPEFLAAVARGDEPRTVSGCDRVEPPLQRGDIVVYGSSTSQHMGVVGEDGYVLNSVVHGGSRLRPLARILPHLLSAWRPRRG